jgi:hypothetical protein
MRVTPMEPLSCGDARDAILSSNVELRELAAETINVAEGALDGQPGG